MTEKGRVVVRKPPPRVKPDPDDDIVDPIDPEDALPPVTGPGGAPLPNDDEECEF